MTQTCTKCGETKPATREFFGSTPSGGLRRSCRPCMAAHSRRHNAANPEQRAARNEARKQRGGHFVADTRLKKRLYERQGGLCMCCGSKLILLHDAEVDHANPVARGGGHQESNLILAHSQCNREKHAKTLDEHWAWRVRVGLPGKRPRVDPESTVSA